MEQEGPVKPVEQLQTPFTHSPFPEQSLGHSGYTRIEKSE